MMADPALREIRPLGKSPVVMVEVAGKAQPLVPAGSAAIVEYLCDYYGKMGSFRSGTKMEGRPDRLRNRKLAAVQVLYALCGGKHSAVNGNFIDCDAYQGRLRALFR